MVSRPPAAWMNWRATPCSNAYFGGNTRVSTTLTSAGPNLQVDDIRGFQNVFVNGVQSAVSSSNPLAVTVRLRYLHAGRHNGRRHQHLHRAERHLRHADLQRQRHAIADGTKYNSVVAATASSILRPAGRGNTALIQATDTLAMGNLLDAVATLRKNAVPEIDGVYNCYLDPVSARQLFADPDFKTLFTGATSSNVVFHDGMVNDFLGLRFIPTTEAFVQPHPTIAGLYVRRPIICGQGALIEGDFAGIGADDVAPADSIVTIVDCGRDGDARADRPAAADHRAELVLDRRLLRAVRHDNDAAHDPHRDQRRLQARGDGRACGVTAMASGSIAAFSPEATVSVAASTTSTAVALGGTGPSLLVYNGSTSTAFLSLGATTTLTATTADMPVPAGSQMLAGHRCHRQRRCESSSPRAPGGVSHARFGLVLLMTNPTGFSDAEKTDIRRFCGYPAYGAGPWGFQGWRFFQAYGLLEYRMNNLSCRGRSSVPHLSRHAAWTGGCRPPSRPEPRHETRQPSGPATQDEVRDRFALLDEWRRRLCSFLGFPPGPSFVDPGITLVV